MQKTFPYTEDEDRFLQLIESMPKVAVQGYDKTRTVIYWNDASTTLYGYTKEEALGAKLEDLILPSDIVEPVINAHEAWINDGIPIPASELILKHKDNHPLHVFSSHIMLDEQSDNPEMFCVDIDMNSQYEILERLEKTLRTDELTGLPNRRMFGEIVADEIEKTVLDPHDFAIIVLDLDDFKEINNSVGHPVGDEVLKEVVARIQPLLRDSDTFARSGGDEYVCLLPNIKNKQELKTLIKKILACFKKAFEVSEFSLFVTASIGVVIYPDHGADPDTLMRHADTAMYKAKEKGKNQYQIFNQELRKTLTEHKLINSALRHSLLENEFTLAYQPILSMTDTKEIDSFEALIRWHPKNIKGIKATPDHFIPIAERTDLIIRIGNWVLRETCKQLRNWKDLGIKTPPVSVNVSGKQLEQKDFLDNFYALLDEYSLKAQDFCLELTEHYLVHLTPQIQAMLKKLQAIGCKISIDDFGTGYSSLSYLNVLPVNKLKVDRSFIQQAPEDAKGLIVIEGLIGIGQHLGLSVVVEGIETPKQEQLCQKMKVDLVQGYKYHKPMTATDATLLLQNQQK